MVEEGHSSQSPEGSLSSGDGAESLLLACMGKHEEKTNRIREKYKQFNNSTIAGGFNTSLSAVDKTSKQKTNRKQETGTTLKATRLKRHL